MCFFKTPIGLNDDIKRHRAKEAELRSRIAELEGDDDPTSLSYLPAYRDLLNALLQSKAELTSKIGKNK